MQLIAAKESGRNSVICQQKKKHETNSQCNENIYGPTNSGATTLLRVDIRTLLTDNDRILERWTEHFNNVLNRPSSIIGDAIDKLPQIECKFLLGKFPTAMETRKSVQQLTPGKAPGADAIPVEIYKAWGLPMAEKQTILISCMWKRRPSHKNLRMHL